MNELVLYYPEGHQNHQMFGHPERPERIEVIREGLVEIGLWDHLPRLAPLDLDSDLLNSVHTPEYLKTLEAASARGSMLDPDTYTTPDSWKLALNAAGGAAAVVDEVWEGSARRGFALTRPPGHHATQSRGMGFCLINNIAVAAEYLLQEKNAHQLAIVDLDLHHGNGTQDIFWRRSEVVFCSIHQSPFYPGTGHLTEVGAGAGEGYTMNLPIPGYSGDQAYPTLLHELVLPFLERSDPDMLLVSFGFDTHWRDPLGSMQLSAGCIHQLMKDLHQWTEAFCGGKLAVILEGGYDLEAGRVCGQAIAAALAGEQFTDSVGPSPVEEEDGWQVTLEAGRQLWGF
jgi:acetoin utilization deacetylase AcuC-like enzyme